MHGAAARDQHFGQHRSHVEMVVVIDHHATCGWPTPGHQVIGGVEGQGRVGRDRGKVVARHRIAPPVCAGGDGDVVGAEAQHVVGRQAAVAVDLDIGQGRDLTAAPVGDAAPGRQAGQPPFQCHPTAQAGRGLGQRHAVAALAQHGRGLQPRWPGPDDQDAVRPPLGAHPFGVPALAPFLHEGGVLGAAAEGSGHVAGHADVAADAFTDVLDAALVDLPRQERVGDGGTRGPDEIEDAGFDLAHHGVGAGEATDADDRLVGQRLDATHQILLRAFMGKARGG